tara:strand:- start:815 stop:1039 length:225 start_codon:yes stop_codon:yes gene_type:complete
MKKIVALFFITFCFAGMYSVGGTVNMGHQLAEHEICYGSNLDPNGDGIFQLAELNGDLNGGNYYVIAIEMSASW